MSNVHGHWSCLGAGTEAPLAGSLNYTAPELLIAHQDGLRSLPTTAEADIWSLGVVAYEVISGRRSFSAGTPDLEIHDMLAGRLPLPWDESDPTQLRTAKHSVLECLSRNPHQRPSAENVHLVWSNLLDFAAVKPTEVA
jgi:serine/threonine protein kinase